MDYPEKFRKEFIRQIEKELNKCEIIYNPNTKGIWFVNREEKYWYLEYKVDTNYLWWRYEFFNYYMTLFSMSSEVFNEVISKWVEETLNCKVLLTNIGVLRRVGAVDETLNCKVVTTEGLEAIRKHMLEETLNCKVLSTNHSLQTYPMSVEDTLNCKVVSTRFNIFHKQMMVEETLNCKVLTTTVHFGNLLVLVEDTLNCKVVKTDSWSDSLDSLVEKTLNCDNEEEPYPDLLNESNKYI